MTADFRNTFAAVHKTVATDNQALRYGRTFKHLRRLFCLANQVFIRCKHSRKLRYLPPNITKSRYVNIVMRHSFADDHIADFQPLTQTACTAGINDAIRCKLMNDPRSRNRRIDLTDTTQNQYHAFSGQFAFICREFTEGHMFDICHAFTQKLNFLFHCADHGNCLYWHLVTFPFTNRATL